jgi:hypothetical protein
MKLPRNPLGLQRATLRRYLHAREELKFWPRRVWFRLVFPFRSPALWWYCQRLEVAIFFGLPLPPPPEIRSIKA